MKIISFLKKYVFNIYLFIRKGFDYLMYQAILLNQSRCDCNWCYHCYDMGSVLVSLSRVTPCPMGLDRARYTRGRGHQCRNVVLHTPEQKRRH